MSRTITPLIFLTLSIVALARRDGKHHGVGSLRCPQQTTTTVSSRYIRRGESAHTGLEFLANENYSSKPLVPLELRRGGASTAMKTMTARQMEAFK